MKNFRRFCLAIALIAAFTMPALADGGETQGGNINGETSTLPGDGHGPGSSLMGDGQCPLTGAVHSPAWIDILVVLQGLLF